MEELIYERDNGQIRSKCFKIEENGKFLLEKHLYYSTSKDLSEIESEVNIQAHAASKSRNIPKILKKYRNPGNEYVVQMEYIEGETLRQRMNKGLSKYNALLFYSQLCVILNEFPLAHKDLKPENIIISKDNNKIYLIDFGSAAQPYVCGTGTKGYQSPEQRDIKYRGDGKLSDIFTLGLILYEMINKNKLILSEEELRTGQWQHVPTLCSQFSRRSNEVFSKMMSINPKDRPSRVIYCKDIASEMYKFKNKHYYSGGIHK